MKQFTYLHIEAYSVPITKYYAATADCLHKRLSQVSAAKGRLQLPFASPNWMLYTRVHSSLSVKKKKNLMTWDQASTMLRFF